MTGHLYLQHRDWHIIGIDECPVEMLCVCLEFGVIVCHTSEIDEALREDPELELATPNEFSSMVAIAFRRQHGAANPQRIQKLKRKPWAEWLEETNNLLEECRRKGQ